MILCVLPKFLIKNRAVKKAYPFITVFTAGIQLATVLVDLIPHMLSHDHKHEHDEPHCHASSSNPFTAVGGVFIVLLALDVLFLHSKGCTSSSEGTPGAHSHTHAHDHDHDHVHAHPDESLGTCNTAAISKSHSRLQALVILLAISAHSFFEGLSVNEGKLSSTFAVGLCMHKILESFALGVAILDSPFGLPAHLMMMAFYSLLTPVGIVLASVMNHRHPASETWFNAFSLGSLLFIVFMEMIAHSFLNTKYKGSKLAVLTLGYVAGCFAIQKAHFH